MRRLSPYRHLSLLTALLLMLVVYPLLRQPGVVSVVDDLLVALLFLAGGWVVWSDRWLRVPGVVLAVPTLAGLWTGYAPPGPGIFHYSAALFELLLVAGLLRGVFREEEVAADAVAAALCGYILLGLAFGHVYCLVAEAVPDSFRGLEGVRDPEGQHHLLTYFSFVTLTTVGYGDVTPAGPLARSLSVVEAVLGQFYLAVLIAGLLGKMLNRPPPPA